MKIRRDMTLRIGHKLFIAILATNVALAGGIVALGDWSFSQSFRDYLDRATAEQLTPLISALSDEYRARGDWEWARDRNDPTWPLLLRRTLRETRRPGLTRMLDRQPPDFRRPPPDDERAPPRPAAAMGVDMRLFLADGERRLVLGNPARQADVYWTPVKIDDAIVGYLGFARRAQITDALDRVFRDRLRAHFAWITAGMIAVSMLMAMLLARRLVRPLHELRAGAHALASGDYSPSLTVRSDDELGGLARDFNALAATLAKNLKARQQWVTDISHELRTPVAVLQSEIEALRDGVRPFSQKEVESLLQEIHRLSRLVNDLHELSLSDAGALSYRKQNIDVLAIIRDTLDHRRIELGAKSISVDVRPEQGAAMLHADRQRLEQLFANLLTNSLSYTDAGGRIEIEIVTMRDRMRILWSDSAPGVRDQDLPRLFDRLYRVDASRNRHSGGAGLGLAIVRNIVEAHDGQVRARHSTFGGLAIDIEWPIGGKRQ